MRSVNLCWEKSISGSFGKSVAAPHMLGAAEALGENAAGVAGFNNTRGFITYGKFFQ